MTRNSTAGHNKAEFPKSTVPGFMWLLSGNLLAGREGWMPRAWAQKPPSEAAEATHRRTLYGLSLTDSTFIDVPAVEGRVS